MATYPGRVSKVILHAPADIWDWKGSFDYSRTDAPGFAAIFPGVRFVAAIMLADRNPDAAENVVSQRELEGLSIPLLDAEFGTVVCKGNSDRLPPEIAAMRAAHENPAMNPYVQRNIQFDNGDPHEALRKDPTPAILLYPECNYVPWDGAVDYRKTMPNLKIYYIPHAGHYAQMEQPDLTRRIMVAFLLDQPDVIPPVQGDLLGAGAALAIVAVKGFMWASSVNGSLVVIDKRIGMNLDVAIPIAKSFHAFLERIYASDLFEGR
jgi:pimeloyl-ACP methyl ester carboxylesterase